MSDRLKAAGAYVFAGLFTQGVLDAGYDVIGVIENGEFGVKTARKNFPSIPVYTQPDYWPIAQFKQAELDFLYANPPCAGYSMANRHRGMENSYNEHLTIANQFAMKVRPKVFAVESVTQLFKDGDDQVKGWEEAWNQIGYQTTRLYEDASHIGLPQQRKRAIFLASAEANLDFKVPYDDDDPKTTVRDAISDLIDNPNEIDAQPYAHPVRSDYQRARRNMPEVTWHHHRGVPRKMATLLPHLPQGMRMRAVPHEVYQQTYWKGDPRLDPDQGGDPDAILGKPSFLYARATWDAPCPVLTGGATYIHPHYDRFFTIREAARIMGLPDSFGSTTPTHAYAEIGKAVSPIVGRWLANQVRIILKDPKGREHKELVNLR